MRAEHTNAFQRRQGYHRKNLIDGATVDEIRAAANDLRALSPESALAELVEAKIERMLAEQTDIEADDK